LSHVNFEQYVTKYSSNFETHCKVKLTSSWTAIGKRKKKKNE